MKSILSEKGQITIPKKVREKHGLTPGVELEFKSQDGMLVIIKLCPTDPLNQWRGRGKLPNKMSVDQYLKMVRDADSD